VSLSSTVLILGQEEKNVQLVLGPVIGSTIQRGKKNLFGGKIGNNFTHKSDITVFSFLFILLNVISSWIIPIVTTD
jgi:hypothetical protein